MSATRNTDALLDSFDAGEDMSEYFDFDHPEFPNREVKRVNVDFPVWMVAALDNEAARRINLDIVKSCVSEMPSPDREIFIDRYYFEMSVREIAARRGVSEKKVWNILSRRKAALKKALIKGGIIL